MDFILRKSRLGHTLGDEDVVGDPQAPGKVALPHGGAKRPGVRPGVGFKATAAPALPGFLGSQCSWAVSPAAPSTVGGVPRNRSTPTPAPRMSI